MNKTHVATATVFINAPASKVWDAFINPAVIKKYLYGTEVSTDWKVGSDIKYRGVWQGKAYEDKGKILEVVPERRLVSTFWSSLEGQPDLPENYKTVRYEMTPEGKGTRVTISNDNNGSQENADHSAQNWQMVLDAMKKVLED